MKIAIIGSGNVATRLSVAFHKAGHEITQVYSRNQENGLTLAQQVHAQFIDSLNLMHKNTQLIIISVSDNAIKSIIDSLPPTKATVVHTAGSIPMQTLHRFSYHGVIYPFQTLSKQKEIDMRNVPFLIEGSSPDITNSLTLLTQSISQNVNKATSEQRQQLHLGAVFACNFVNHMFEISKQLLEDKGLSFNLLMPLISETVQKIQELTPEEAQTGPAVRHDSSVMEKHMHALVNEPAILELYQKLSENIMRTHPKC